MSEGHITITPIAGSLGAEIHGVSLSDELSEGTIASIRRALIDHLVIFFLDQSLNPAQQIDFARQFGSSRNTILFVEWMITRRSFAWFAKLTRRPRTLVVAGTPM